jgi:tetrahydromethanopterin S-methyltransferase subunit G
MQTMRESWTDERLDEFGKRIDERFDRVDERFDDVQREMRQEFGKVDKRLDRLADGLESVQRALIFGAIAMSSAFLAGFAAIATQL